MALAAERVEIVDLETDCDGAERACAAAIRRLGWMPREAEPGMIAAHEDVVRLNCRTTPSCLQIELSSLDESLTAVTIKITAPGIGPVPARRASRQADALARRIQEAADEV